jgi:predicted Na+-dependent transporter
VAVVAIVLARDGDALGETFAERVPLVAVLALGGSFALGWSAGRRAARPIRIAIALVTAVRASGPALAIAGTSFAERPGTRLAIVVFALVSVVGSSLAAVVLARTGSVERLPGALEHD